LDANQASPPDAHLPVPGLYFKSRPMRRLESTRTEDIVRYTGRETWGDSMHGHADAADQLSALLAPIMDSQRLIREIDEPLGRSAPLAFEAAQRLCDPEAGHDCRAYHAVWQYLRHTDVWRSIRTDGTLFVAAAERLAREGRLANVLVSGSADYSMLAHIAHGGRRGGAQPAIDVLDQCATPLHMNEWYAAGRNLVVRVFQSKALSFEPDRQYDLICTHSFLIMQPFAERAALFRKWSEWLRPGGRLCFSDRISTHDTPHDPAARDRRIEKIASETLARAAERGIKLPCPDAEFAALIREFGINSHMPQPAMPLEAIESWATEAGLTMDLAIPVERALQAETIGSLLSESRPDRVRIWFQFRRP